LSEPFLCRLGFHKWQDYGNQVAISWGEPETVFHGETVGGWGVPPTREARGLHTKLVFEGKQCKRCGVRLMRKFVKNSDGTISCVGWEPSTQERAK